MLFPLLSVAQPQVGAVAKGSSLQVVIGLLPPVLMIACIAYTSLMARNQHCRWRLDKSASPDTCVHCQRPHRWQLGLYVVIRLLSLVLMSACIAENIIDEKGLAIQVKIGLHMPVLMIACAGTNLYGMITLSFRRQCPIHYSNEVSGCCIVMMGPIHTRNAVALPEFSVWPHRIRWTCGMQGDRYQET